LSSWGDAPTLEKFARKRVNLSELLQEGPIIVSKTQMIRRQITVRSIKIDEPSDQAIEALVQQLKTTSWRVLACSQMQSVDPSINCQLPLASCHARLVPCYNWNPGPHHEP